MKRLTKKEIDEQLKHLKDWMLDGDAIKREWTFQNFSEAIDFINMVAVICEAHDHHPQLYNVYNSVSLRFYTHSAGGLTMKDFAIAADIDKL